MMGARSCVICRGDSFKTAYGYWRLTCSEACLKAAQADSGRTNMERARDRGHPLLDLPKRRIATKRHMARARAAIPADSDSRTGASLVRWTRAHPEEVTARIRSAAIASAAKRRSQRRCDRGHDDWTTQAGGWRECRTCHRMAGERYAARRHPGPPPKRACEWCGRSYQPKVRRGRFCGDLCCGRAREVRRKAASDTPVGID